MKTASADGAKRTIPTTLFVHEGGTGLDNGKGGAVACIPMHINDSITVEQLADEYCITSVVECDSTGSIKPRTVALDSPLDVLHRGKYYVARRDMKHLVREPRVTFRGKITVKEFNSTQRVAGQGGNENGKCTENTTTELGGVILPLERREREEYSFRLDAWSAIDVRQYAFVPFVGDLYNDGKSGMIHLEDVKRLCENVDLDEAEFKARHARAERTLATAKQLLLKHNSNGGSGRE